MSSARPRLASAAFAALVAGAAAGAFLAPETARGGPTRHLALDEEFTIRMRAPVAAKRVTAGKVVVQDQEGNVAAGSLLPGTFRVDPTVARRVVVRPEAVREHFHLNLGLSLADATNAANRLLRSVARTGDLRPLRKVDRALRSFFGPSYGAGTRLDDPIVFGMLPPQVDSGDRVAPYRRLVAGDDALWAAAVGGDAGAYAQLGLDPDSERFRHETDPDTGLPYAESVLRRREHRRVLVRSDSTRVTFVPRIPESADLSDTTFAPSTLYTVSVARALGRPQRLVAPDGIVIRKFTEASASFRTVAAGEPFADTEGAKPRVVSVTPPLGETLVDPTSDWEDPEFPVAGPGELRRTFRIRLRFASPLRPDSVTPANFTLFRTIADVDQPIPLPLSEPLEVTVALRQSRLGEVCVDVTPVATLPPKSRFELSVKSLVQSLGGETASFDQRFEFSTR